MITSGMIMFRFYFLFAVVQNALELTAPASDVLLRNNNATPAAGTAADPEPQRGCVKSQETAATCNVQSATCRSAAQQQSWFQLSGHPDCFAPAGLGTIWKKCSGGTERDVYEALSNEPSLQDIVPKYYREVEYNGQTFIELQDLLYGFRDPNVMDIKMGTRTFLESEVKNSSARRDLYLKVSARDLHIILCTIIDDIRACDVLLNDLCIKYIRWLKNWMGVCGICV